MKKTIKIISTILIAAFLAQDLAWAYPSLGDNNKLAVTGLQDKGTLNNLKTTLTLKLIQKQKAPQPIDNVTSAEALSNYIDILVNDINVSLAGQYKKKLSLSDILSKVWRYQNTFCEPLFRLLLTRLSADFANTEDFVASCRNVMEKKGAYSLRQMLASDTSLLETFSKIRCKPGTANASIGFYGLLLFYLTPDPRYFEHLYDEFMNTRPVEGLTLARKDISYHARGDSVVHFYDKGLLFEGSHPLYMTALKSRYKERLPADRKGSLNAEKIIKALVIWRQQAETLRATDPVTAARLKKRLAKFRDSITVLELDMKTKCLFSDPDHNVVRIIHAGRSRRALYISKDYLDGLSIKNDTDMRALALWLNFGERFLDTQEEMIASGADIERIEKERSEINLNFFETEDSHLLDIGKLKQRLSSFMKSDSIIKYGMMLCETMEREKEAQVFLDAGMTLRKRKEKEQERRYLFTDAWRLYGRLLYRYEGLGLHSLAERAYSKLQVATEGIQLNDVGILPLEYQMDLISAAIRFEQWDSAIEELRTLLTGKGYPRNLDRPEIVILKTLITSSRPDHNSFEDEIRYALAEQAQVSTSDTGLPHGAKWAEEEAKKLFKDYFADPFSNLQIDDINYSHAGPNIPSEKEIFSGDGRKYETAQAAKDEADELSRILRTQEPKPSLRNCFMDLLFARSQIVESIWAKVNAPGNIFIQEERKAIRDALDAFLKADIFEFDTIAIPDKADGKKFRSWLAGFNTMPRSLNARSDILLNELQDSLVKEFPNAIFMSRQVLDWIGSDEELFKQYIFSVIISHRVRQDVSRYLQGQLFRNNYYIKRDGPYTGLEACKLHELIGRIIEERRNAPPGAQNPPPKFHGSPYATFLKLRQAKGPLSTSELMLMTHEKIKNEKTIEADLTVLRQAGVIITRKRMHYICEHIITDPPRLDRIENYLAGKFASGQITKNMRGEARQRVIAELRELTALRWTPFADNVKELMRIIAPFAEKYRDRHGFITKYTALGTFVPSNHRDIQDMFNMAEVGQDSKYLSLGSGLGNDTFIAAMLGADATGVEFDPELYRDSISILETLENAPWFNGMRIKFKQGNYLAEDTDFSQYDILYWYYNEGASLGDFKNSEKLQMKLMNTKFKPGSKLIISGCEVWHGFNLWKSREMPKGFPYCIYMADENGSFVKSDRAPAPSGRTAIAERRPTPLEPAVLAQIYGEWRIMGDETRKYDARDEERHIAAITDESLSYEERYGAAKDLFALYNMGKSHLAVIMGSENWLEREITFEALFSDLWAALTTAQQELLRKRTDRTKAIKTDNDKLLIYIARKIKEVEEKFAKLTEEYGFNASARRQILPDDIFSAVLIMGQVVYDLTGETRYAISNAAKGRALILYADDVLERGTAADLAYTLQKTSVLNDSTIILYGRKAGRAELLEKIIKANDPDNRVKVISLQAEDLQGLNGGKGINIEYDFLDEAKELDFILRHVRGHLGINNGNLLGVIKGRVKKDCMAGIEDVANASHTPVVLFEHIETNKEEKEVYSFRQALALLISAGKDPAPSKDKEWSRWLKPIQKKDIEKAYQDYRRALEVAINA